jgi:hypothetical protein
MEKGGINGTTENIAGPDMLGKTNSPCHYGEKSKGRFNDQIHTRVLQVRAEAPCGY